MIGGEHEMGYYFMVASMCVLMYFKCVLGQNFSRLWAALEQVALAYL